jgi:cytochrome c peroxidase
MKKYSILISAILFLAFCAGEKAADTEETQNLTKLELLGKKLFFDAGLSDPPGQSCAFCHDPTAGWTGPDHLLNKEGSVYEGAKKGRFGNRKPPSSAYAGASPPLYYDEEEDVFIGGMFWDGRATGWSLKDPIAEQAKGPFLNPLEQNMADSRAVVRAVKISGYSGLFEEVWGPGSLDDVKDVEAAFEKIARSIAAYERSEEVNPFSSKFDLFWGNSQKAGKDVSLIDENNWAEFKGLGLDDEEVEGLMLFAGKGLCAECHLLTPGPNGEPPLLTDFTYDNLGIPRNPLNPFYKVDPEWNPDGEDWIDPGLGGFLADTAEYKDHAAANLGKHKVPTLRNVDLRPSEDFVKAFMHNGVFKSLKEVVHFYNARDVESFPPPEFEKNINKEELGNLKLTEREEDLIVLFMKTLSDGFLK